MLSRYLTPLLTNDLKEKMVFVGGPRQVGKTTLALQLPTVLQCESQYLNWDDRRSQKKIISYHYEKDSGLLIFDELHKWKDWKNYLKGLYDTEKVKYKILVTGSARLDFFRKGGDSLLGRYHYHVLHPLSVAELLHQKRNLKAGEKLLFQDDAAAGEGIQSLFHFGGFPEPFLKQNEISLKRWHDERTDRLVKDDIRDIENLRHLSLIQLLVNLLSERAGTRLSLNNLRADLGVSHNTISTWLEMLERFYYHFRISPYQGKLSRSLKKEQKIYLWDWSEVEKESARFENMVASHLLKYCHFLKHAFGEKTDLMYLRDREGREVDFLVTLNRKPWFAVEAKMSDTTPSKHLKYFQERLDIPFSYQVVFKTKEDFRQDGLRVISAKKFLSGLV